MGTTTLITFLLRTSPQTKSVKLLGSWDNFSSPYSMERDARVGPGHWRGCHTFRDIICDGETTEVITSRTGGLKMGGTYWYFYQLDGEIEFHNPVEPSTTACPLLPGQMVNVLHVPTQIGSLNRSRADSSSSTSSEYRTMNPEDKYLNPRPVPKPTLPKLSTLPKLAASKSPNVSPSSTKSNDPFWAPRSATVRKTRMPRDASVGKSRSLSPRPSAFRAALNQLTAPRSAGFDIEERGRPGARIEKELDISAPTLLSRSDRGRVCVPLSAPSSMATSRNTSPTHASSDLRSNRRRSVPRHVVKDHESHVNPMAVQRVRSSRSRSREPSPLRKSISFDDDENRPLRESVVSCLRPLETLEEQNTPGFMPESLVQLSATQTTPLTLEELREKRLPTLPNSPSSAIDEDEEMDIETPIPADVEPDLPKSHFSAFTTNSNLTMSASLTNELPRSHFSEFSLQTVGSPSSAYSSTFDCKSPSLSGGTDHSSFPTSPYHFPTMPDTPAMNDEYSLSGNENPNSKTSVKISSLPGSEIAQGLEVPMEGLCITSSDVTSVSLPQRPPLFHDGHPTGMQRYKLPEDANASDLTLKRIETPMSEPFYDAADESGKAAGDTWSNDPQLNHHTTTMQQLLDELSYLGEMIQN